MSVDPKPLKVVICWHMHQPDYRGPDHSDYQLPWVYLHATKDYVDMVAHLEEHPKAKAVVNFAPVLLEQLADYAKQIRRWLDQGRRIHDPLLAALAGPGLPADPAARRKLVRACLRANETHLINPYPVFRELADMAAWVNNKAESIIYFKDQYLVDLLVWYHLAWMGESVRENDLRVSSLAEKGRGFDTEDRRQLVTLIGELLEDVLQRYRRLAESGRVELSVTPYAHPIVPLLLDVNSAAEAMPEAALPAIEGYPGGEPRARWHIRQGIRTFEEHFGFRPQGCWPSEGSISDDTLRLLEEEGFRWAASGQQVLRNSLDTAKDAAAGENWVHRPYRLREGRLGCFFRDDGLSDLIGFTYADWHADDAVGNLIQHLETIDQRTRNQPDAVVSIIMDGENAWEYYPRNGSYFLSALYQRLSEHPRLQLTTFSDMLADMDKPLYSLPHVVPGSWVYGTFSTWIGDPDKNRAWEMLEEAKRTYDAVMAEDRLTAAQVAEAEKQLATCEGSDWFWWFGDYNPGHTVSDFERLYRRQLRHLYRLLGEVPPTYLSRVFAHGSGDPSHGGVMRQNA